MKTIREYIDLIESAQNPAKPIIAWVEPATCSTMSNDQYENNPFANETGDWKPIHTQEELAVWQDRREEKKRGQALGQNPVAEDTDEDVEHLANAFADIYYGGAGMGMISATEKVKLARNIVQAVDDGRLSVEQLKQDLKDVVELQQKLGRDGRFDKQGVAEALSKTDLLKQVSAELNNPEFRKKPVDPTKSFTRGDYWQGAKPGDYGYTGYQGHGMPTDKAERERIRADKKKGLPEDEATAKMGLMSAMGSNDNNPADQRRAMAQQAVERLATKR